MQLSQLDDKGKDELALLVAQRGVVVFREQIFENMARNSPWSLAVILVYFTSIEPLDLHVITLSFTSATDGRTLTNKTAFLLKEPVIFCGTPTYSTSFNPLAPRFSRF